MDMVPSSAEHVITTAVQWLKLGIEATGAAIVALGVAVAIVQLLRNLVSRNPTDFTAIRLTLARYLALAVEFTLGADIIGTAISPSWDQIGKLGAIAVIRTGLNIFLSVEMKGERVRPLEGAKSDDPAGPRMSTPP